ncbi:hypothetical protein DUI70_2469 [Streptomyces albus]|nr:hypothetical protein DUI70_2469 [Streptomyces albus]
MCVHMNIWREDAQPGHTHDPNEVTVQLDGAGRQLAELLDRGERPAPDTPVFVDETGRRSRTYRTLGVLVGLACAGYAAVIAVTLLSGNAGAPWLPLDGPPEGRPAGKVEPSQVPAGQEAVPGGSTAPAADPAGEPGTDPATGTSADPGADPSATPDAEGRGRAERAGGQDEPVRGGAASTPGRPSGTPGSGPKQPAEPVGPGPAESSGSGTATAEPPPPAPSAATGETVPLTPAESPAP